MACCHSAAPSSALTGLAQMSKPREVIARAIQEGYETRHLKTDVWLEIADAVIDALEKMEVTEAMRQAETGAPFSMTDARETAENIWRAMVGAMRDE